MGECVLTNDDIYIHNYLIKLFMNNTWVTTGRRESGRPARTWGENIQQALNERNLTEAIEPGNRKKSLEAYVGIKVWKSDNAGRRYEPVNDDDDDDDDE